MNMTDAFALAAKLKGAIPTMTDLQSGLAVKELETYAPAVGAAAVDRYIHDHEEFRLPTLATMLQTEAYRLGDTNEARLRAAGQQRDATIAAYWSKVDATIADLTDDDLAAMKADVLPKLPAACRELVKNRNVRESKILKSAIYDALVPA